MKKIVIIIFSVLITNLVSAQKQAIKITNQVSDKEIVIKENKRVKIRTVDGKKMSGRFSIENNLILIDNQQIELSNISHIKRHPLLISILSSGLLIYGGAITLGFGVLLGVLADASGFLLAIPAAAMIFIGIKSPNFNKNFKSDKGWSFKIVTLPSD